MFFSVLSSVNQLPRAGASQAFLVENSWDDWFEFSTTYILYVFDADGVDHMIGSVKIGQFEMNRGQRRPALPASFDDAGLRFFSLGQDDSYYEGLQQLDDNLGDRVLVGLRDVAHDEELFTRALQERVTGVSLLRFVTLSTVRGQYRRLAMGGARLSRFELTYSAPKSRQMTSPVSLRFTVEPESYPPTNIHVVIGRNGVGKTHLLNAMTRAIVDDTALSSDVGEVSMQDEGGAGVETEIANLVSVSFSAFDEFEPLADRRDRSKGVRFSYVGLKRPPMANSEAVARPPKSPTALSAEFGKSVANCMVGARAERWRRALTILEADPVFRDTGVSDLADESADEDELKVRAKALFGKLSSGHKIVLLTITRLVETVEERTMVLLDEPEAHLHPPLLSAFVRSLSDLLINRNGLAIIATHSPVVLQEVPKSCVWKIRRTGGRVDPERPEIETFGENVGVLTREVFGLEVTHSGFHTMLVEAVAAAHTYEEVIDRFEGELGGEARAIVRALMSARANPGGF